MTRIINILAVQNVKNNFYRQPIEFYLAHIILKYPEVFKKAKEGNSYKIVDCSACELGSGVDMKEVIKAAKIVGASEIVLPDIVRSNESLKTSLDALNRLSSKDKQKFSIAIVVQGRLLSDAKIFLHQLAKREEVKFINTIMIPKWFTTFERVWLTSIVNELFPDKQIHWLGLGNDIGYCITRARRCGIRSLDTGYFVSIGEKRMLDVIKDKRDVERKVNLIKNNLKYEDIRDICNITNTYNYEGAYNEFIESLRDREFVKIYNRITITLLFIIAMSLVSYVIMNFIK